MARPHSPSSPHLPSQPQKPGSGHTVLPVEVWINIFNRVSELPGQSLAPLAAVCPGWQHEIEKLTFASIVVRTNEHDMTILRRVMENSRRASCLSKITLSIQAGSIEGDAVAGADANGTQKTIILRICDFVDCLGNSSRGSHHPPLTLDFDGLKDPHVVSYDLEDKIQLTEHLRAHTSSQYGIGRVILSLDKTQLPDDLFEDIVRYLSPKLKNIDLALVTEHDDDSAVYNTLFMKSLQQPLRLNAFDEFSLRHPKSFKHQEEFPSTYRDMMTGLLSISRNFRVFRVNAMAADVFFNMSKNMQWPNLHTLEIVSLTLGGTATTFYQDDYLENAVALVTKVAKAASRMKNLQRLELHQRLWR